MYSMYTRYYISVLVQARLIHLFLPLCHLTLDLYLIGHTAGVIAYQHCRLLCKTGLTLIPKLMWTSQWLPSVTASMFLFPVAQKMSEVTVDGILLRRGETDIFWICGSLCFRVKCSTRLSYYNFEIIPQTMDRWCAVMFCYIFIPVQSVFGQHLRLWAFKILHLNLCQWGSGDDDD